MVASCPPGSFSSGAAIPSRRIGTSSTSMVSPSRTWVTVPERDVPLALAVVNRIRMAAAALVIARRIMNPFKVIRQIHGAPSTLPTCSSHPQASTGLRSTHEALLGSALTHVPSSTWRCLRFWVGDRRDCFGSHSENCAYTSISSNPSTSPPTL